MIPSRSEKRGPPAGVISNSKIVLVFAHACKLGAEGKRRAVRVVFAAGLRVVRRPDRASVLILHEPAQQFAVRFGSVRLRC